MSLLHAAATREPQSVFEIFSGLKNDFVRLSRQMVNVLVFAVLALATFWHLGSALSMLHHVLRHRPQTIAWSRVSILKPLSKITPTLEDNLRSFFELDGTYELVFGAYNPSQELLQLVQRLEREYPHVPSRFVSHSDKDGNPKVSNLRAMAPYATHDWILISDDNMRVPRNYLTDALATQLSQDAAAVTSTFVGAGEDSLAGLVEAVHLNGFVALGALFPTKLGDVALVGKSVLVAACSKDSGVSIAFSMFSQKTSTWERPFSMQDAALCTLESFRSTSLVKPLGPRFSKGTSAGLRCVIA